MTVEKQPRMKMYLLWWFSSDRHVSLPEGKISKVAPTNLNTEAAVHYIFIELIATA